MAFHILQKAFCGGCESHIFLWATPTDNFSSPLIGTAARRRLTEKLKAAFCKKTDSFTNFHCADDGFCTGSTQDLRMDPCIMKTLHAETVNGSVWGHQDKKFPFSVQ